MPLLVTLTVVVDGLITVQLGFAVFKVKIG
jgi:hypothetical protein